MDLSQYAELFLAESREHLSACNQLLGDWERTPANPAPVAGLFRAVHTVKGMAATMGYGRVTDIAHRTENLLDLLRRGSRPATDELLQLLFRARDALEHAVELSVVGREDELDVAEVVADLESAAALLAGPERPAGAAAAAEATPERSRHIRVDLRRLDELMDLIGELVTVRGRLNELAAARRDPAVDDVAIQISRLSADLQAGIIQARMTPVWQVFDRFPRLVRDLARELDKQVAFRVEGKEIELDRAILDELGDPLLHLLRNAVDHGIETQAERRRRGKKPEGEIVLAAVRERASVAISVSDDGRGIDRARILERARREGLVDAHAEALSDDQLLRVLARPGFSTAEAVTSVSGRGVGIDVAVTRSRALGGSIDIRSEPGKGTVFVLRLPVTLASVRALIAGVGKERYALPLTYVAETVEFGAQTTTTVEGREAIVLRDRVVPLVHLRRLFGVAGDPPRRAPVIVLEMGERRAGVVVDGMLGQHEIVVKGFDAPQGTLPVFSGATIMGDGIPALILDAGGLL